MYIYIDLFYNVYVNLNSGTKRNRYDLRRLGSSPSTQMGSTNTLHLYMHTYV